jgi:hypothetical protein
MISITVTNSFADRIKRLKSVSDTQRTIDVTRTLQEFYRQTWATRGANTGNSWGRSTVDDRVITLRDTGTLFNNMIALRYASIGENNISVYGGTSYAGYVQDRYNYMKLSEEVKRRLLNIYTRQVREVFAGP